jgi:hypothetical protein
MKRWLQRFFWIKVFFSPFKTPKIDFYFGNITMGVPYFLPRRIVNGKFIRNKWFAFNSCSLGWKTKWGETDYRFEWGPVLSFVFLKKQFCVFIVPPEQSFYWESWLYYERNTDKTKSVKHRIEQCIKNFPQTYIIHENNKQYEKDFYSLILKKKYEKIFY